MPRQCGRMYRREDGVDLVWVRDRQTHTLRLRFHLVSQRKVRVMGTGVVYGALTRVDVRRARVTVKPARHRELLVRCVRKAVPLLRRALQTYVERFLPATRRLLDLSEAP